MILHRLPHSRFSEVVPNWKGDIVAILGSGPSLTKEQIELLWSALDTSVIRAIAVNDTFLLAPWADVLYGADARWWKWMAYSAGKPELGLTGVEVRERFEDFDGERCSIQNNGDHIAPPVHLLRNRDYPNHGIGLSRDPGVLVTGWHSGFQALNLAILAGATTILLLGFDGRPNVEGKTHFFGEHPKATPQAVWEQMRKAFSAAENEIAAAGVKVWNCSPDSAIDSFPKMALEDALGLRPVWR